MHRRSLAAGALALALSATSACYHAVVDTGRPAGTRVVRKPWVNTFLLGYVAAPEIKVGAECPAGVARVETQHSLLNALVGVLSFGIYTPQSATITCATVRTGARDVRLDVRLDVRGHAVVAVADGASRADRIAAVRSAAAESARTGQPVFVRF